MLHMGKVYDGYFKTGIGLAMPYVKDYQTAQDIAQLSMIKVWNKQDTYRKDKGAFYTWFRRIVIRTAIDEVRKNKKTVLIDGELDIFDKITSNCLNVNAIDLDISLKNIKPKYADIIRLHFMEGYTQKQISDMKIISLGTVKSRIKIGIRELNKIYSN